MILRRAHGFGGIDVYLRGGMHVEGVGDEETVAYDDLDGLCAALGRAIALRDSDMSGAEARYLRKRLDMSQADLGAIGGKSEQAAAKWEKGRLPMPKAEANLLRLRWLQCYSPTEVNIAIIRFTDSHRCLPQRPYAFGYHSGQWSELPQAVKASVAPKLDAFPDEPLLVSTSAQEGATYAAPGIREIRVLGIKAIIAAGTAPQIYRALA